MKIHDFLERYFLPRKFVVYLYRTLAFVGFALGVSVVLTAVVAPEIAVGITTYLISDAVLEPSDSLRVSRSFLVALYGVAVTSVSVSFYLFTEGFIGVTARKPTPLGVGRSASAPCGNPQTTAGSTPQYF